MSRLITAAQVAKILHKTPTALANWRHKKIGLSYVKIGGAVRYYEHEVFEFLKSGRVATEGKLEEERDDKVFDGSLEARIESLDDRLDRMEHLLECVLKKRARFSI